MDRTYVIKYEVQKEDDCYLFKAIGVVEAVEEEDDLIIDEEIEFVNGLISNPDLKEIYIETVTLEELKECLGINSNDEEEITKAFIENILQTHYFVGKVEEGKILTQQVEMESPIKQIAADYLNIAESAEEVTEQGLEDYLNERFVGYEKQNRQLARILFNNLEINTKEDNETILMVGKDTKLISSVLKYAAEYLGLPYKRIGIDRIDPNIQVRSSTIEDEILDAIKDVASVEIAHLGIVAIDGISEINNTSYGSRNVIIDNLRSFVEGETIYFSTDTESIPFDTSYLTKVFIGTFEGYPHVPGEVGFIKSNNADDNDDFFTKLASHKTTDINLLNSVDNLITYDELSYQDKIRYLLTSKLSILVRKEIEMKETYQVDLEGQEDYVYALIKRLVLKYMEKGTRPSIEEISREIRSLLHLIIRDLKENEECDTVILDKDTVNNGTYQLVSKKKVC